MSVEVGLWESLYKVTCDVLQTECCHRIRIVNSSPEMFARNVCKNRLRIMNDHKLLLQRCSQPNAFGESF